MFRRTVEFSMFCVHFLMGASMQYIQENQVSEFVNVFSYFQSSLVPGNSLDCVLAPWVNKT